MNCPQIDCPSCEGKGVEEHKWDSVARKMKVEIVSCKVCHGGGEAVRRRLEELIDGYSGNAKHLRGMTEDGINEAFLGPDGREYRRLMKWYWENPEDISKDQCPNLKKFNRTEKLPEFKAPKEYKPIPVAGPSDKNAHVECKVDCKVLLKALKPILKVIERNSTIPILRNVKITAIDDSLELAGTDLSTWIGQRVDALVMTGGSCTVPAHRLSKILQLVKGQLTIRLLDGDVTELRAGNTVYKIHGLSPEDFPLPKEETEGHTELEWEL